MEQEWMTVVARLASTLRLGQCDHTHKLFSKLLKEQGCEVEPALEWARSQGGYCDCEVCMNISTK